MFSVYYLLYNDRIWVGDFPTYKDALDNIENTGKLLYYENGVNDVSFDIYYNQQLYQELVYTV